MKAKICLVLVSIVIGLALIVGVPFLINELYKIGPGYITLWEARDVLSYYGTVLGAIIAVVTLSATIVFTRKQIIAENTRKAELEKWEKVNALFQKALVDINPQRMTFIIVEETPNITTQLYNSMISRLQLYRCTAKISLDTLKCFVNPREYQAIEQLANQMIEAIGLFCKLSEEYETLFFRAQAHYVRLAAFPEKAREKCMPTPLDSVAFNDLSDRVSSASETVYQPLLNSKRDVFAAIYKEINERANQRLSWFPKKEHQNNS